jgi:acetyl-CoA carboxylase carboxyltransferase component
VAQTPVAFRWVLVLSAVWLRCSCVWIPTWTVDTCAHMQSIAHIQHRPDLELVNERHEIGWDENRPNDVARRRRFDQRTARENIFDLCDDGTFVEYGPLVVARQRRRQTEEWLREHSAGDGMVCGVSLLLQPAC